MALVQHFPKRARSPEEQAIWLRDYLADLDSFSVQEVESACTSWRQSDAGSFPKIGELLSSIKKFKPRETERVNAWEPIPDSEFDALPLSEQARHHRILAIQAKRDAGPMWIGGRQAGPQELSADWHRLSAVAKNHSTEAGRLDEILRESRN